MPHSPILASVPHLFPDIFRPLEKSGIAKTRSARVVPLGMKAIQIVLILLFADFHPLCRASNLAVSFPDFSCENLAVDTFDFESDKALENVFNGEFQRQDRADNFNDDFGKMEKQFRQQITAIKRSLSLVDGRKLNWVKLTGRPVIGFNETRQNAVVTRNYFAGIVKSATADGRLKLVLETADGFERTIMDFQNAELYVLEPLMRPPGRTDNGLGVRAVL
jgi:hypothetical protein